MKGLVNELRAAAAHAGGKLREPVPLAWLSAKAFRHLKTIPEAELTMSYADYRHNLESVDREFAEHGVKYELVPIDVDLLITWCDRNGQKPNSKGRGAYAAVLAMSRRIPGAIDKPLIDQTEDQTETDAPRSLGEALRDTLAANHTSADDFMAAFDACVDKDATERPPQAGQHYEAFAVLPRQAGPLTLAIAHNEGEKHIVDLVRGGLTIEQIDELMKAYGADTLGTTIENGEDEALLLALAGVLYQLKGTA